MGSGHTLGERGGEQAHTLSISEIPTHIAYGATASSNDGGDPVIPTGNLSGAAASANLYVAPANLTAMNAGDDRPMSAAARRISTCSRS